MIPLSDDLRAERFPIAGLAIAVICCAVFIWQLILGEANYNLFVGSYGFMPAGLFGGQHPAGVAAVPPAARLVTYLFLHGNWWHLLGNMMFLWVFADKVEDALGHARYVVFYLLCGICAALGETWAGPHSSALMIGASGAVSGVLGAYLVLHPKAEVSFAVPILIVVQIVRLPAWVVLLSWFGMQIMYDLDPAGRTNIAFTAHITGFIAGILLAVVFVRGVTGRISGHI